MQDLTGEDVPALGDQVYVLPDLELFRFVRGAVGCIHGEVELGGCLTAEEVLQSETDECACSTTGKMVISGTCV